MGMKKKKTIYLIDGSAIAYRAYYAMEQTHLTNSEGMPTGACYAFVNTMFNLINEQKPDYVTIFFDGPEKTFRHKMYEEYKANRQETPDGLIEQIPVMHKIAEYMNVPVILTPGYEADDGIGTLAKISEDAGMEVYIVSADKDLMQLLTKNIHMFKLGSGRQKDGVFTAEDVVAKYGIKPTQVADYLAMLGDKSDNIPGIYGIGKAKAVPLLKEYESLENILKNINKIGNKRVSRLLEEGKKDGFFSKKLATIKTDVPLDITVNELEFNGVDKEKLYDLFEKLDFQKFIDTFSLAKKPKVEVKKEYYTVNSIAGINEIIQDIKKAPILSVGLKTTSQFPIQAEIVGVGLSWEKNTGVYIPIQSPSRQLSLFKEEDNLELLNHLKIILEDESIPICGQNIKYDWIIFKKYNINLNSIVFDNMIAAFLLHPDMRSYKLGHLSQMYLNYTMMPIEDLLGKKKNKRTMGQVDIKTITYYAAEDADVALQLVDILKEDLKKYKLMDIYNTIELPLVTTLGEMEMNGVFVNAPFLKNMSAELDVKIEEIAEEIYFEAEVNFNIKSPKQLSEVLFEKLQLPNLKKGSTAVEVLEKLQGIHPLPSLVLEYRKFIKLQNTYLDTLPLLINSTSKRIHSSFNQAIASTGRLSSSNPNFQNIPARTEIGREIRKAFVAQNEDWKIIAADYSQIELRIMAHLSEDEELIHAFKENLDIHRQTAALVNKVSEDEVTSDMRRQAKVINFGVMYGASSFRISNELNISMKEAKGLIEEYFATYPGIKNYISQTIDFARENGFVKSLSGRIRYTHNINSPNKNIQQAAERAAINMPIQGTAADMIKIAMIKIQNILLNENWQAKMILQVHDELIFECPVKEEEKLKTMIVKEMADAIKLSIPVNIDVGVGKSWYEAH